MNNSAEEAKSLSVHHDGDDRVATRVDSQEDTGRYY